MISCPSPALQLTTLRHAAACAPGACCRGLLGAGSRTAPRKQICSSRMVEILLLQGVQPSHSFPHLPPQGSMMQLSMETWCQAQHCHASGLPLLLAAVRVCLAGTLGDQPRTKPTCPEVEDAMVDCLSLRRSEPPAHARSWLSGWDCLHSMHHIHAGIMPSAMCILMNYTKKAWIISQLLHHNSLQSNQSMASITLHSMDEYMLTCFGT